MKHIFSGLASNFAAPIALSITIGLGAVAYNVLDLFSSAAKGETTLVPTEKKICDNESGLAPYGGEPCQKAPVKSKELKLPVYGR